MDLAADLLPARGEADVLSRRVGVVLGGQAFNLPVLTIERNRAFKARLVEEATVIIDLLDEQTELGALLRRLAQGTEFQLECLAAFDATGVLPVRSWIEAHATEQELWTATKAVVSAAFPFVDGLRQIGPTLMELARSVRAAPTSSSLPSTAGRRGWLKRN